MAQNSELSLNFYASGYCSAHASVVNPKEGKGKTTFYAVWALLNIPNIGYVLFDTGYSEAFENATNPFPDRLYRWATPVTIKKDETAKSILEKNKINADDIRYVIISHFHADHIAGICDFPNAQFICSNDALQEVNQLKGFAAVSKGILHGLIPADFFERISTIEDFADKTIVNEYGMVEYELFGLKAFKLVLLPGHAKGMLGFIFDNGSKSIFYATDASWSVDTYSRGILPKKIVKLFFDSWKDFKETLQKMRAFEKDNKQFAILFTHCKETLKYVENEI